MKKCLTCFIIALLAIYSPSASYAKVINLLEDAFTSDESLMYNKSEFCKTWHCYWKNGEAVPDESRPISIFSKVRTKEGSGTQLFAYYPDLGKDIMPSTLSEVGFKDGMPVIIMDYPADNNHPGLYYSIPITVKYPGEYKLTGSVQMVQATTKKFVAKPSDFCTTNKMMLFVADKHPCKKEMRINLDSDVPRIDVTDLTDNSLLSNIYQSFADSRAVHIDKTIYLDKDVKYLSVYAPAIINISSTEVLMLGDLRLEPVEAIEEPEEPAKLPLTFKQFSKCVFTSDTYSLERLGLTTETDFNWENADLNVSCDKSDMIEISGKNSNTIITPIKSEAYPGYPSTLPYCTLTVSATDKDGTPLTSSIKLYVAPNSQPINACFNYLANSNLKGSEKPSEICTTSEHNSWEAIFSDLEQTDPTAKPPMEYVESKGWKIDFGNEIRKLRLRLESNMLESGYSNNPVYTLKDLSINVDETECNGLRIYSEQEIDGQTLTKRLEPDNYYDEQYYTSSDAEISKEIILEASGTLYIKNISLEFLCNFDIPMPLFKNVEDEDIKATYINSNNPKDADGKELWDSTNPLPIEYRIEPDVTSESTPAAYAEDAPAEWTTYRPGEQIFFGKTEKLIAHTAHPHGMFSIPNEINYSVITGVDNPTSETAGSVRYFNLQGQPICGPQVGGIYIKVSNGKAEKITNY